MEYKTEFGPPKQLTFLELREGELFRWQDEVGKETIVNIRGDGMSYTSLKTGKPFTANMGDEVARVKFRDGLPVFVDA